MAHALNYTVVIEAKAQKEASRIPIPQRSKIDQAILALSADPRPRASKKLATQDGYRIRIGDYRVLYVVDDEAKTVVIYRIKIKGKRTYKQ